MTDISVAERRLIAALDRLDHAVDRAARRRPAQQIAPAQSPAAASTADLALSPEIAQLHDRQGATLEAMQMRLAEAHERLAGSGQETARLAAANDDLARANRALIDAAGAGGDDGDGGVRAALEAEIEALRAARAAEIAQMSEILDALDRMLGVSTTPRSHSTASRSAPRNRAVAVPGLDAPAAERRSSDPVDAGASKATPVGKAGDTGGFDGVYGEHPDLPDAADPDVADEERN